jgi:hypothetical protein
LILHFVRGEPVVETDRGMEDVLREEYTKSGGSEMDQLHLYVKTMALPAHSQFNQLVMTLKSASRPIEVAEHASTREFCPLVQYLRALSITAKSSNEIELVADGEPIDVAWSVEGVTPNRLLVLSASRSDADKES